MVLPTATWSETEIEVRYAETDQMGVVHHANYLVWFELARTDLCALSGTTYAQIEDRGFWLMVTGAHLDYRGASRYGDRVRVRCAISRVSSRLQNFAYEVVVAGSTAQARGEQDPRIGTVVVSGSTEHAWVDAETQRSGRLPADLFQIFSELAGV